MVEYCKWAALVGGVLGQLGGLLMLVTLRTDHGDGEVLGRMCGGMLGLVGGGGLLLGWYLASSRPTGRADGHHDRPSRRGTGSGESHLFVRFLLAAVAGGGAGVGAFFLALGLLPEFAPTGREQTPERVVESERGFAIHAPEGDSPGLRAEKHRLSTACGIGCLSGAVAIVGLFIRSRGWVTPSFDRGAELAMAASRGDRQPGGPHE